MKFVKPAGILAKKIYISFFKTYEYNIFHGATRLIIITVNTYM